MLLANISLFLKIVEKGSLTAAGREVGLSPTTVSERLAALEAHFGVVLLNRTTRAISLTDEGRTLIEGAKSVLHELGDLETRIRLGAHTLSGPIRVSAPSDLGQTVVADFINELLSEHPALSIELLLSDGFVDIVGEGIDIALRFGATADSTLRIRHLADVRRVVCASPDYLLKHPAPQTPADLKNHNCLVMRFGPIPDNQWRFGTRMKEQAIVVSGNRISNDGELVRRWAVAGHGIALKSELDVSSALKNGTLVELLPNHAPPPLPLQMLFPPSRAQPRRVRVFADLLAGKLKAIAANSSL